MEGCERTLEGEGKSPGFDSRSSTCQRCASNQLSLAVPPCSSAGPGEDACLTGSAKGLSSGDNKAGRRQVGESPARAARPRGGRLEGERPADPAWRPRGVAAPSLRPPLRSPPRAAPEPGEEQGFFPAAVGARPRRPDGSESPGGASRASPKRKIEELLFPPPRLTQWS